MEQFVSSYYIISISYYSVIFDANDRHDNLEKKASKCWMKLKGTAERD